MALESVNAEKENLLANLYSLRAGISLACMYKHKGDSIIEDGKRQRAQLIAQSQGNLNTMNSRSAQVAAQKEETRKAINSKEAEIDGELYFLKKNQAKKSKKALIFSLFFLAMVAALLFTVYLVFNTLIGSGVFGMDFKKGSIVDILFGWMYNFEAASVDDYDNFFRLGFGGLAGFWGVVAILLVLVGIGGTIFLLLETKNAGFYLSRARGECTTNKINLSRFERELEQLKQKLAELDEAGKRAENTASVGANDLQKVKVDTVAIINQASAKATPYVQIAAALVTALDCTFTQYIDIRDWENLDYIIYCIETRRSDNMKEALLAVDRQRQTEQIVAAIEAAGREISRTLNSAIARLQDKMVRCFAVISGQLERQSRQLSVIASKIDDVATAQNMSNALLTMQNVTSMAMLGELNKISNATNYVASCISAI